MCRPTLVPLSIGEWVRRDDGIQFRVADVTPQHITIFDSILRTLTLDSSRYLREGFSRIKVTSSPGTDFSPFQMTFLPWTRQKSVHGVCAVERCEKDATEGWSYTSKRSTRYSPAERFDWFVCQEHWFFPDDYKDATDPMWGTDWGHGYETLRNLIVQSVNTLSERPLQVVVPTPLESDVSIYDAIMIDDD